jgi:hypothetical protein
MMAKRADMAPHATPPRRSAEKTFPFVHRDNPSLLRKNLIINQINRGFI